MADDCQLTANALSGLSAEYIPLLLRKMQSLDLTMVHDMLREVYVKAILPNKANKFPLRGYRSETAMSTTTGKNSGKQQDVSEVVCQNCKRQGPYANNWPVNKPLPGDTPPRSGAPHTRRSRIQMTSARLSRKTLNQLSPFLHYQRPSLLQQRRARLPSRHVHMHRLSRRKGYSY